jgi:hypothetical protein
MPVNRIALWRITVVLLRISSLAWFLDAVVAVTHLPSYYFAAATIRSAYTQVRQVEIMETWGRVVLYNLIGIGFLAFAKPLAHVLTRGLESTVEFAGWSVQVPDSDAPAPADEA